MDALDNLYAIAGAYSAATGLAETTVSMRALKGAYRLRDLRTGQTDIGVHRLSEAIQWFSDNWPPGADWPYGIARPAPSTAEAQT